MIQLKSALIGLEGAGLDGLRTALQAAMELEHATLPPYLYALYSIRPGFNVAIARTLKSVVLQEMLHLSLCCNVLNAIGGTPLLNGPKFIPSYPGTLPGGVEDGLVVPLAPLSRELVHDIFMVIEEPEDPLEFPVETADRLALKAPRTIGQFYAGIKRQLQALAQEQNIFTGHASNQLISGLPGLIGVSDLTSALAAIDIIVVQGEGTAMSPLDALNEPAHYYRFAEVYNGRRLVPRDGVPPFAYGGDHVAFEADGVLPVVTNPSPELYTGTVAAPLNNAFNYTYTSLLNVLHDTFNGAPSKIGKAIGLMESIKHQAIALMTQEFAPGKTGGPTFTYRPVE